MTQSTSFHKLVLKKEAEAPIRARHMWIFSGAVSNVHEIHVPNGSLVEVVSSDRSEILGYAVLNRKSNIIGRMIDFTSSNIATVVNNKIETSFKLRKQLYQEINTSNAEMYRLINAEGDGLSGLVVDVYGKKHAVIQISSMAMEICRKHIIKALVAIVGVESIYERSTSASRDMEGLLPKEGLIYGKDISEIQGIERDIIYPINLMKGQKTGFFLDQREMRSLIRSISFGKQVVNCFSYTGGFSLNALYGKASHVTSIDISQEALDLLEKAFSLNPNLQRENHQSLCEDVFLWLQQESSSSKLLSSADIVILDPPAFAKTKKDIPNALKGYYEINRRAMIGMKKGSLLLTCSCSYHISQEEFHDMLYRAAKSTKRDIRIISSHRDALDHMSTIYHRETHYLKSYLIAIA